MNFQFITEPNEKTSMTQMSGPIHKNNCSTQKLGQVLKQKSCFDCPHCFSYQLLERIHPSKSSHKRRLEIFETIEKIFKTYGIKV
jgi:DNA polymerase sigma